MIGQSDLRPQSFEVNILTNGMAEILFFENITEKEISGFEQEAKTVYEFEMYELSVQNRVGLYEDVEANYSDWISFAKGQSKKPVSDKEKIIELENKVNQTQIENVEIMTMLVEGGII